ncbi:MAG: anaerobic ribonucleoside-triphosphate reductase [Candidatus Odinarchaeia archaeon]
MPSKKEKTNKITPTNLISAVSNQTRTEMLKLLSKREKLTFTDFLKSLKLDGTQTGKLGYHLKALKQANIISESPDGGYSLTEIGRRMVDFIWEVEDLTRKSMIKFYVRTSKGEFEIFDRNRIKDSLIREAGMPNRLANQIAKEAEDRLIELNIEYLTSSLIREFVNAILLEKGFEEYRHSLTRLGLPIYDVTQLIENSQNMYYLNPDYLIYQAGLKIFEEYLLQKILPPKVTDAHLKGEINIPHQSYWIFKVATLNHKLDMLLQPSEIKEHPQSTLKKTLNQIIEIIKNYSTHVIKDQVLYFFNAYLAPLTEKISQHGIEAELSHFFKALKNIPLNPAVTIILDDKIKTYQKLNIVKYHNNKQYNVKDYEDELLRLYNVILDSFIKNNRPSNLKIIMRLNYKTLNEISPIISKIEENINILNNIIFVNKENIPDGAISAFNQQGFKCNLKWLANTTKNIIQTGILDYVNINILNAAENSYNIQNFQEKIENQLKIAFEALKIKYEQINQRLNKNNLLPLLSRKIKKDSYYKLENSVLIFALSSFNEAINTLIDKKIIKNTPLNKLNILKHIYRKMSLLRHQYNLRLALSLTPEEEYNIHNTIMVEENLHKEAMIEKINSLLNGGYITKKQYNINSSRSLEEELKSLLKSKIPFFQLKI